VSSQLLNYGLTALRLWWKLLFQDAPKLNSHALYAPTGASNLDALMQVFRNIKR
jgi:hypothetical protein